MAISERFVRDGHRVVATARRQDRLDALCRRLGPTLLPLGLDMNQAQAIAALPGSLPEGWREIDVLVANAGLALGIEAANEARLSDWEQMVATNVTGLMQTVHALLPGMVARDKGHVVTLGSIAGDYAYPGGNVYGATKAFVRQFVLNLKADLVGRNVRVTDIEPGLCGGSEFSNVRFADDNKAAKIYEGTTPLTPQDIAEAVAWVVGLPRHVNINRIELMPTCQAPAALTIRRDTARPETAG